MKFFKSDPKYTTLQVAHKRNPDILYFMNDIVAVTDL